jgi:iron(III) transport system substrate-binding protein
LPSPDDLRLNAPHNKNADRRLARGGSAGNDWCEIWEDMMRPRGLPRACAGVAVALLAATLARANELTPQEQKLVAAARQEGSVTLLNALFSDRTGERLAEGFIKRYDLGPNFKLNNLRKGTGATVAQVRQEISARKFTVDILLVNAPGFFDEAAKRGAFETLDSGYWKDHEALAAKAGQYFNYPTVVIPFAYTFQPVWNTACPGMERYSANSYDDVVKPELKGKTIASDLTKSSTYVNTALALAEAGVDVAALWDKLKATDPLVEFRTEPKMQMVVSCQRPLDMWNLTGRVYQGVVSKPDLGKVLKFGTYREGQVMLGNQASVLKGAPHPAAAKLLIEYLLSREGTDIFVEGEAIYSFMKDYKPPATIAPYLFDLTQTKLLGLKDWIAAQQKFATVRDAWQKIFQ